MQYLAFTRPDLAFDAHKVNKFMHKPHDSHWLAVKRISRTQSQHNILQFQQACSSQKLVISDNEHIQIQTGQLIEMIGVQLVHTTFT